MSTLFPIIVLISGNGSNLQAIIDTITRKKLPIRIQIVISDRPHAYGLKRAQQANIPTHVLDSKNYSDRIAYDQALQTLIDESQPKLVVLAGFMRILTTEFVQHYDGRLINIHPSLLPQYPGLHTHSRVLAAKETQHGATVHFVTEKLDSGPIIAYAPCKITLQDTIETLQHRVHQLEHSLYPQVIEWFASGRLRLRGSKVWLDSQLLPPTGFCWTPDLSVAQP